MYCGHMVFIYILTFPNTCKLPIMEKDWFIEFTPVIVDIFEVRKASSNSSLISPEDSVKILGFIFYTSHTTLTCKPHIDMIVSKTN